MATKMEEDTPVRIIRDTRQSIVPGRERRQQPKEAAGFVDGHVDLAGRVALQVADAEEEKGQIEREEEEEEGDGRAKGSDEEDGGEDEPALLTKHV